MSFPIKGHAEDLTEHIHYTMQGTHWWHHGGTLSLVFAPVSLVLIKLIESFLWSWLVFLCHLPPKQLRKTLA